MTSLEDFQSGDRFRLVATKDRRLKVGSRGVVEAVKKDVDRYKGEFVCLHVRFEDGSVAGLVDTLGDEVEREEL